MISLNWLRGKKVVLVASLCSLDQVNIDLVVNVWVVIRLSNTDARDVNHLEVNRVSCNGCMGSSLSVQH